MIIAVDIKIHNFFSYPCVYNIAIYKVLEHSYKNYCDFQHYVL